MIDAATETLAAGRGKHQNVTTMRLLPLSGFQRPVLESTPIHPWNGMSDAHAPPPAIQAIAVAGYPKAEKPYIREYTYRKGERGLAIMYP